MSRECLGSIFLALIFCLLVGSGNAETNQHLYPVKVSEIWGYIDRTGKWVIKARFAVAMPFSNGLARVRDTLEDKWHYIDRAGRVALVVSYWAIKDFGEDRAPVFAKKGWWGYMDKKGQIVIQPVFTFADPFTQGLAPVVFLDIEQGLPYAEIYFDVLARGKRYQFHINDCFRSPRGWRSPDGVRYRFEVKKRLGSGG